MTRSTKKAVDPASAWLIDGKRASKRKPSGASRSQRTKGNEGEWGSPSPKTRKAGGGNSAPANGTAPSPSSTRGPGISERLPGLREARLNSKLRRAREKADRQEAEIAGLKKRVKELEGELSARPKSPGASKRKPRRQSKAGVRKPESKTKSGGRKAGTKAKAGRAKGSTATKGSGSKRDLNTVTFEELRGLGLSVTESARLVAYRDQKGRMKSMKDLDTISGFSKETRQMLTANLRVRSA